MNTIQAALEAGRFGYMVELVASAKTTEQKIVEIAQGLATIPGLVGVGVTSYAGGSEGHDPIRIAELIKPEGVTPNVHITCVNQKRADQIERLKRVNALGVENVFAISGDYPLGAQSADYDLDSVQLTELIAEMRAAGTPFYTSVAVSPFKYTKADCNYQYLKLEKKIKAGANFAITQLGYDMKKYIELKRYLDERGLKTPVFGNVYVLALRASEKFAKAEPPGCWAAPELVEKLREESTAEDKGVGARMERAAKSVAVLRGLGYAGAYIGGTHDAKHLNWIVKRADEIAGNWQEYAEEITYAPKGGYYYFGQTAKESPKPRGFMPALFDATITVGKPLKPIIKGICAVLDMSKTVADLVEHGEYAVKHGMFGCQKCGNCVLGYMEYTCPMTCPKQMRNGPCGGTHQGQCEVYTDKPCIWVQVYDRAEAANRVDELKTYIPPRHRELEGTSSYINYFLGRDSRPETQQPLIQIKPAP